MASTFQLLTNFLRVRLTRADRAANATLTCEKALLYFDAGRAKDALDILDAILRQPAGDLPAATRAQALRSRHALLCLARRFADARADIDALLDQPDLDTAARADLLMDKGWLLMQEGDTPGALALCETVHATPDAPENLRRAALHNICILLRDTGGIAAAIRRLDTFLHATTSAPADEAKAWALPMLKSYRYEADDIPGTLETLTEIIETTALPDETRATAHLERGILRERDNLQRMAILDYTAVLAFTNIPIQLKGQALLNRADAHQQLGDNAAAALDRATIFSISTFMARLTTFFRYALFPLILLALYFLARLTQGD